MQPFFWSKLGNADSRGSFWHSVGEDEQDDVVFSDIHEVFSAEGPAKAAKVVAQKKTSTTVSVLDISKSPEPVHEVRKSTADCSSSVK